MSTAKARALPDCLRIASSVSSAISRSRSNTPTVQPSAANRVQIALPMAPPPPVTIAVLPLSPRTAGSVATPGLAVKPRRPTPELFVPPSRLGRVQLEGEAGGREEVRLFFQGCRGEWMLF